VKTNRREFFRNVGAGVAAVSLSTALPAAAAAPAEDEKKVIPAAETFPIHPVGPGRRKQMFPIKSELKSKRIKHDAPIDPISWAYMKELRENNRTRVINPINPYVEVYQFRENLFGLFTHNLDGGGDVWMFLTIGPEKAMLVDTAYGLGDIKGLCDQLSGGKPLYVAVTHEHFDHAYGACLFDKVYCHEYLAPYLAMQNPHQWDYLFDDYGDNIWVEFDRNDLPKFKKYEIAGMKDGYIFDLGGGHEIELLFQGGHSAGHAAYLDKKNRIVFTGDNIICDTSGCGSVNVPGRGPHGENQLLKVYRENLKRLVDRSSEFDYVYPAHFMVDVERTVLNSQLDCVDAILADPEKYDWWDNAWAKGATQPSGRYAKHIHGFSVVYYGYNKA
jgi:glyoxylase-like metal-dependent hydrolase (beta-lactamase superfamily II)